MVDNTENPIDPGEIVINKNHLGVRDKFSI